MRIETLFDTLPAETGKQLDVLLKCIDTTFALPEKYIASLPSGIAALSRLLTSARSERHDGYLNTADTGGAYLRYFLPWNVYRLCKLFASDYAQLFFLQLFSGDDDLSIIDLGSGPMTLALALWISFPALRRKNISLFCVDHNKNILRAGKKLFCAFLANTNIKNSPWNIKTINEDIRGKLKIAPATLVCAINVFNELYWNIPQGSFEKIKFFAEKQTRFISTITNQGGAALIVEPGIPRCGQFINLMKEQLESCRFTFHAPCPPETRCPLPGGKRGSKWCHFTFDTKDSPRDLQKLSMRAGLKKEKAVLSFLLAKKEAPHIPSTKDNALCLRIVSDLFALPAGKYGRYACSKRGLLLLSGGQQTLGPAESGTMLRVNVPVYSGTDKKSGALVVSIAASQ
jgi:ribosomal protein RSM22 (predicted rRNA methylase)